MPVTADNLLSHYRRMLLIRRFEETLADLFAQNRIGGTSHFCIGQEACAVGVIAGAAAATDWIVSHHRGHGHALARGLDPARVFAELMGRRTGYCGGRGGSQHMCAMDLCFLGTNGITGGGLPIAAGAAFALKYRGSDRIVLAFFGDGACNQGTFHESLNLAAIWKLPVLYICENNQYGMSTPVAAVSSGLPLTQRAAAYGVAAAAANGMDVSAVAQAADSLIAGVRTGNGPAFLELQTYRFCGHSKNDPRVYRTREEEADWAERDCLIVTRGQLEAQGMTEAGVAAVDAEVAAQIAAAAEQALATPVDDPATAAGGVYA